MKSSSFGQAAGSELSRPEVVEDVGDWASFLVACIPYDIALTTPHKAMNVDNLATQQHHHHFFETRQQATQQYSSSLLLTTRQTSHENNLRDVSTRSPRAMKLKSRGMHHNTRRGREAPSSSPHPRLHCYGMSAKADSSDVVEYLWHASHHCKRPSAIFILLLLRRRCCEMRTRV